MVLLEAVSSKVQINETFEKHTGARRLKVLANAIAPKRAAFVLRGYRGTNERSSQSILVSDGTQMLCDVRASGDEAYMLAKKTLLPVVVGKNKAHSCLLLEKQRGIDLIILDDAYQNHQVYKNFELLLLDARWPLENGHCLPAGRLREKDLSRANCVFLTHAEGLNSTQRAFVQSALKAQGAHMPLFFCTHVPGPLRTLSGGPRATDELPESIALVAGIGSFEQFVSSAQSYGLNICATRSLGDHAPYSLQRIQELIAWGGTHGASALVTTAKDAVKIEELLSYHPQAFALPIYILDVSLGFVDKHEEQLFFSLLAQSLGW